MELKIKLLTNLVFDFEQIPVYFYLLHLLLPSFDSIKKTKASSFVN